MYLNCHSYFSLRYGTLSPEHLVEAAAAKGVRVLALTDINNTSAALPFVRACERHGIKPVLGVEFRSAAGKLLYVGLARNLNGWSELCGLLTDCSLSSKPLPELEEDPFDQAFDELELLGFALQGRGIHRVQGFVTVEFDFVSVQVSWMERLPYRVDSRFIDL